MNAPNLAVVELKAFVPAQDFALSMEFYQALGFTRASVFEDIAYFHCGESSFLLQDFYVREHVDNFQMHLLVDSA
jgi:predicted lactoylglutathione lyase